MLTTAPARLLQVTLKGVRFIHHYHTTRRTVPKGRKNMRPMTNARTTQSQLATKQATKTLQSRGKLSDTGPSQRSSQVTTNAHKPICNQNHAIWCRYLIHGIQYAVRITFMPFH